MTELEDLSTHAKILSESYDVPPETMTTLLTTGGTYVYPQIGGILTRGLFACRIDSVGQGPKQTWTLDLMQFAEAEQVARSRALLMVDAAWEVFWRTLPGELQAKLQQKNLGLDYRTLDRAVAKGGDIKYIDFRTDWSPHFKRLLYHAGWTPCRNRWIARVCRASWYHCGTGKNAYRTRWHAGGERRGTCLSDRERSARGCAV